MRIILLLFLLTNIFFAQNSVLVSTENIPSTFVQSDTKIFELSDSLKIAVWRDTRNAGNSYFAQLFNSTGNLIGENFQVSGSDNFSQINSGAFVNLSSSSYPYFDGSIHYFDAAAYNLDGELITEFNYAVRTLGWCGTGYLGMFTDVLVAENCFVTFACLDGVLSRRLFNYNGEFIENPGENYSEYISERATLSAAAISQDGVYLNAYFENDYSSDYYDFTLKIDVYDSDHSRIDSISVISLAEEYMYLSFSSIYDNFTQILVKPNGNFLVLWLDPSTAKFYFNEYSISDGWNNAAIQEFFINDIDFDNFDRINNFNFSKFKNDKIYFFFGYRTSSYPDPYKSFNGFYELDENLNLINGIETNDGIKDWIGKELTLDNNANMFIGLNKNSDAYLGILYNFSSNYLSKLNDDERGSNEVQPSVTFIEENNFFVTWQDEVKIAGLLIDQNNNLTTEEKRLEGRRIINLNSGYKLNTWEYGDYSDPKAAGYNVFDEDWNLYSEVLLDTLASGELRVDYEKFPGVLIAATLSADSLKLFKIGDQGNIITKKSLAYNGNENYLKLWNIHDSVLAVHRIGSPFSFDLELNSIQTDYTFPYGSKFLISSDKIVSIYEQYNGFGGEETVLDIYSLTGDTLYSNNEIIGWYSYETAKKINEEEFLIAYKNQNRFYGIVISSEGIVLRNDILLGPDNDNPKKDLAIALSNDKIRFVWSEARESGKGYSIYSSISDKSIVTSIKEYEDEKVVQNFKLEQNYPNPFNPTTVINFTIPSQLNTASKTTLKVYDILGKVVVTLIDKVLASGSHKIEFNANDLASGVYFYRLQNGNFAQTKKMLLLK